MAVEALFKRTLRGLEPANDDAWNVLKLWKLGQEIRGEFKVARSNERLNWWWALCQLIAENSDTWATKEKASDSLKLGIGISDTFIEKNADGQWEEKLKPGSIAFGNKAMTEDRFRAFCVRAQNYVCTDMLGCEGEDLARALEDFLNPDSRRQPHEGQQRD